MKKIFAIAIATFFLSTGINAQVKRDVNPTQKIQKDKSHHKIKEEMAKLDLSQEQRGKLKIVMQDAKQQRDAIKNDASLTQAQKGAKMKQLKETQKQKVSEILTPAQRVQAKADLKEMKANRAAKEHGDKGGKPKFGKKYQKEIASLDLSQAQKDQIKNYVAEGRKQSAAIKSDASLTPAQKKAKLKAIKTDTYARMQKTLTPDQRAKAKVYIEKEMGNK